jgi:hypothetical protein
MTDVSPTTTYNIRFSELKERVNGSHTPISLTVFFEIKVAYQKDVNQKWAVRAVQIKPTQSEENGLFENYGNDCFISVVRKCSKSEDLVFELMKDGLVVHEDFPAVILDESQNWCERLIPSHASEYGVPLRHFVTDLNYNNRGSRKLIQFGLEFYESDAEYLRKFMRYQAHDNTELHFLVPDKENYLSIDGDNVSVRANGEVQVVGKVGSKYIKEGKGSEINIGLASDLELWLVGEDGKIYDYVSTSEHTYPYKLLEAAASLAEEVEIGLSEGEGLKYEFKKYINLTDPDSKIEEISRSVCAFSNSSGGMLLIGVSDLGEVSGIESHIKKSYKSNFDESVLSYKKDISKIIYESIYDASGVSVEQLMIRGRWVVVVCVKKSSSWNYLVSNDIPYVRRGATNFNGTRYVISDLETQRSTRRGTGFGWA